MTPRTLRIVLLGYAAKSLILGIAWLMVPDLPRKAAATARHALEWASAGSRAKPAAEVREP